MKLLETLKAEGRIEEARQHGLLQLIEHPQHAELHYEVASLHDMQGREAQAIPLYQKAIRLGLGETSLRGAWLGLGSSYRCTGQYAEALAAFDEQRQDGRRGGGAHGARKTGCTGSPASSGRRSAPVAITSTLTSFTLRPACFRPACSWK